MGFCQCLVSLANAVIVWGINHKSLSVVKFPPLCSCFYFLNTIWSKVIFFTIATFIKKSTHGKRQIQFQQKGSNGISTDKNQGDHPINSETR